MKENKVFQRNAVVCNAEYRQNCKGEKVLYVLPTTLVYINHSFYP